jgi:putative ABC transport system permease protein
VGVVGNVKYRGLDQSDTGTVYWPFVNFPNGYVVLRATADPVSLATSLRQAMRELDPNLAVTDISTGEELVSTSLVAPRYLSVLIGMFAAAALLLSVVGIYGVMAYFVQQHTRDIGIRLALGGEPSAMRRMVVRQGLGLVATGVVAGLVVAFFTARLLTSRLFGVSPTDPLTLIAVAVALVVVAVIACLVPARRAARLDPAAILRES